MWKLLRVWDYFIVVSTFEVIIMCLADSMDGKPFSKRVF